VLPGTASRDRRGGPQANRSAAGERTPGSGAGPARRAVGPLPSRLRAARDGSVRGRTAAVGVGPGAGCRATSDRRHGPPRGRRFRPSAGPGHNGGPVDEECL